MPATTSTTSSTTSTVSTTSTTSTIAAPTTASARVALPETARAAGQSCKSRCVSDVVKYCYDRCTDNCGVDWVARNMSRTKCRNYLCPTLTARCTESGSDNEAYLLCCSRHGTCDDDVNCEEPAPTTTTTAATTTTTTTAQGGAIVIGVD